MIREYEKKDILELEENMDTSFLYLYTPMCGTCQVAGKMINIVAELFPLFKWGMINLNFIPDLAKAWEIESVPCLLIFKQNQIQQRIYAFHSVPFLYDSIKQFTDK